MSQCPSQTGLAQGTEVLSPTACAAEYSCSRPAVVSSGGRDFNSDGYLSSSVSSTAPPHQFSLQAEEFKCKDSCYLVVDLGGGWSIKSTTNGPIWINKANLGITHMQCLKR